MSKHCSVYSMAEHVTYICLSHIFPATLVCTVSSYKLFATKANYFIIYAMFYIYSTFSWACCHFVIKTNAV